MKNSNVTVGKVVTWLASLLAVISMFSKWFSVTFLGMTKTFTIMDLSDLGADDAPIFIVLILIVIVLSVLASIRVLKNKGIGFGISTFIVALLTFFLAIVECDGGADMEIGAYLILISGICSMVGTIINAKSGSKVTVASMSGVGSASNSRFCPNCGGAVEKGAPFCTNCGTKVE